MEFKQFFIDNFDLQSVVNSFLGGFVVHILNCIKNFIFSPEIRISIDLNDENLFKTIPSGIDILHSLKLQVRNEGRKTANNIQTKKYKITFSYDCNSIEKRLIISKFNINKEIF